MIYLRDHKKWAKYLREGEDSLTEAELKARKKKHFAAKLFYMKL